MGASNHPDKAVAFDDVLAAELGEIDVSRWFRTGAFPPEVPKGRAYERAHAERLLGLAFSGGGIRSATFNLGVLSALAELKLLRYVDYLSTVSGGGYIGSWLTAWIKRATLGRVDTALVERAVSSDEATEAPAIRFLRRFSNYLTPRAGLFTADTWAAVSTYLRNLVLNLIILTAFLSAVLLVPRLAMPAFLGCTEWWAALCTVGMLLLAILGIGVNLVSLTRPPDGEAPSFTNQGCVLVMVTLPSVLTAWFGSCALWWCSTKITPVTEASWWTSWWIWTLGAGGLYCVLWVVGWVGGMLGCRLCSSRRRDPQGSGRAGVETAGGAEHEPSPGWLVIVTAFLAGSVGGALIWALLQSFVQWNRSGEVIGWNEGPWAWTALAWGPVLLLGIFTITVVLHIGLVGKGFPERSREWWSRLGAWILIVALGWSGWFAIALYAPQLVAWAGSELSTTVSVAWLVSTAAGLWAGHNSATGGRDGNRRLQLLVVAAPPIFVIGLLVALSSGIQLLMAHWMGWLGADVIASLSRSYGYGLSNWDVLEREHWRLLWDASWIWAVQAPVLGHTIGLYRDQLAFLICVVVGGLVSWRVDINQFSLHLLYRNRLTRCYLGASREHRVPNPFTGFDERDDLRLTSVATTNAYCGPYPIVNVALNLVSGKELAWQQRKAASFVLAPRFCGYNVEPTDTPVALKLAPHGYRETSAYAGGDLSLGTAVAISGAAASPNMGYHSSPPLAFLMTIFNVRLGWWIGNPRRPGKWKNASPQIGLPYLLAELFGSTNDEASYVYLSDGGHFENLGIYELVRRRCRFIVACDGGQDGDLKFEDLGNAIRKCRIDFGIDIEINVDPIRKQGESGRSLWHWAIGRIHYEAADAGATPGTLLYLKASLTGDEPTDVLNYAAKNPPFPHQTTGDQWFDESQFESYHKLGYHIATGVLTLAARTAAQPSPLDPINTEILFEQLRQRWYPSSRNVRASFTKHTKTLGEIIEKIRTDAHLEFLDAQIYPEWEALTAHVTNRPAAATWLPDDHEKLRSGFYLCLLVLQLMEDVYLDLDLEAEHQHPDNSGWMNLFRHWSWCGMLRATWAVAASTYGARFQDFCERELGLRSGDVSVEPLVDSTALNFVEADLLWRLGRELPNARSFVIRLSVPDPSRAPHGVAASAALEFTVGFAVTVNNKIAYLRVQDHLRKRGLAREALRAMRKAHYADGVDMQRLKGWPDIGDEYRARVANLFDSVSAET